jgi:phosphoglycerate dehydrogenase-like enzyme/predicted dehydrogenase
MKNKIRIAVIGAGAMSQKIHLPIIKDLSDQKIYENIVLCDLNKEAAAMGAKSFGFSEHTHNADDIFSRSDVDAVYVFGTAQMHYDFAKKALENNKHVFIEKPPAPNSDNFNEITKLAVDNKLVAAVGFNRRFQPAIQRVKSTVESNGLYAMEAVFHKPAAEQSPPFGVKSFLTANAIHAIDVLLYVKGSSPSEVYSISNKVRGEFPQNFSALLKWDDGTHATFSSDNSAGARVERYVFHGYDTTRTVDSAELAVSKSGKSEDVSFDEELLRGFTQEHEAFAEAINSNSTPVNAMNKCMHTVQITELIESGFSGRVPELDTSEYLPSEKVPEGKSSILVLNVDKIKHLLPRIQKHFNLVFREDLEVEDKNLLNSVNAVITGPGGGPVSDDILEKLPQLQVVGIAGASVKKYNPETIVKKGIPIINASDRYAETVAEFILLQAITGVRKASLSHDVMRGGGWGIIPRNKKTELSLLIRDTLNKPSLSLVKSLMKPFWKQAKARGAEDFLIKPKVKAKEDFRGVSFGIVGYGEITKKVIPLLKNFDCVIKIYSEYLSDEEAKLIGVEKASMDQVLQCSVISLQRGLSKRTVGSFGRKEFNAIKPGSVFINSARGELIDTKAMLDRLKKGDMFACLDVYGIEPLPTSHLLRKLPNVFLTSHIAGGTQELYAGATERVVDKVLRFLSNQDIDDVVDSAGKLSNMT